MKKILFFLIAANCFTLGDFNVHAASPEKCIRDVQTLPLDEVNSKKACPWLCIHTVPTAQWTGHWKKRDGKFFCECKAYRCP